jgi:hypothetical protein
MADLMQLSIHGVPVASLLAMLVAFWALGMILTRGGAQRESTGAPRTRVVPPPVRREAPAASRPATAQGKLAV